MRGRRGGRCRRGRCGGGGRPRARRRRRGGIRRRWASRAPRVLPQGRGRRAPGAARRRGAHDGAHDQVQLGVHPVLVLVLRLVSRLPGLLARPLAGEGRLYRLAEHLLVLEDFPGKYDLLLLDLRLPLVLPAEEILELADGPARRHLRRRVRARHARGVDGVRLGVRRLSLARFSFSRPALTLHS